METLHAEQVMMMGRIKIAVPVVLLLILLHPTPARCGDGILERVEQTFSWIQDFSATLTISVDMERMNVPPMTGKLFFKQPDKMHIDAEGFMMVPRDGLALSLSSLGRNYEVRDVATDTLNGKTCSRLTLIGRNRKRQPLALYVDTTRWTPEGFVRSLPQGRTLTGVFGFVEKEGHWIPIRLDVRIESPDDDSTDEGGTPETDFPRRRPQMPKRGLITIEYSDVEINAGIPDEIFKKEDR